MGFRYGNFQNCALPKVFFFLAEGISSMNLLQKELFIPTVGKREYFTHRQLMCINVHWVIAFLVVACIY